MIVLYVEGKGEGRRRRDDGYRCCSFLYTTVQYEYEI
jgi:hypothetical protein